MVTVGGTAGSHRGIRRADHGKLAAVRAIHGVGSQPSQRRGAGIEHSKDEVLRIAHP